MWTLVPETMRPRKVGVACERTFTVRYIKRKTYMHMIRVTAKAYSKVCLNHFQMCHR